MLPLRPPLFRILPSRLSQPRLTPTRTATTAGTSLNPSTQPATHPEPLIPPPRNRDAGPILRRSAHRALPPLPSRLRFYLSIPVFLVVLGLAGSALVNYSRSSSSVVSSTLYALRRSAAARRELGDEIDFASAVPWVGGTLDQVHGKVDLKWAVKGRKARGRVRLWAERVGGPKGRWVTREWSLEMEEGRVVQLLEEEGSSAVMGNPAALGGVAN